MTKEKLTLKMGINEGEIQQQGNIVKLPLSTLLVEGQHNGILFLRTEIEKAKVPDVFPLTLNHSRNVEDEVGWWEKPLIVEGQIKAIPVINLETAKGSAALGYVKNRLMAGLVPEVSVEVWADIDTDENGNRIAKNLEIDKASLVDRGACNPEKGCGVGLKGEVDMGVVPNHPWRYGKDAESSWSKPRLSDFTDKSWDELSDKEKRSIAGHFAWAEKMPPENFGQLKLPHHDPKSHAVVWNGVRAAMAALFGARGGVDIPTVDKKKVYTHLAAHYKEFDKQPPEVKFDEETGEILDFKFFEGEEELFMEDEVIEEKEEVKEEQLQEEKPIEEQEKQKEEFDAYALCREELEAIIKEKEAKIEELEAKVEALSKELEEKEKLLNSYIEKEKAEIIAELQKLNPEFDPSGKSLEELRILYEFAKGVKLRSGRKSLVFSPEKDEKLEYEEILRKKVREFMRREVD